METPQLKIDPYQSSVPLVPLTQMPEQDLQGQQAPRIYSKTAGIAQFADTAMKGLLKGLQMKEERKFKTAEATMQAQDAGIGAARKNYEDLLTTKGAFEADGKTPKAETQAAYQAWSQAVDAAAAQRQAFAIPDQKGKGDKSKKKDKNQPDQVPAGSGFGAGLKQFFERNPHIVPELAIIGMKAQVTPYGQMAPEQQAAKMNMDAAQRQEANQKVIDAARATYDKYAGRPNLTPQEQSDFENAKLVLTPFTANQKYQVLLDPQGQQHNVPMGTEIPEGWKVYEKPTSLTTTKPGTEQDFTKNALAGYGVDDKTPPGEKAKLEKYLHDWWNWKQTQSSTSVATSTTDVMGNRTNTNQTTRGATEPKPPSGFAPVGENGQPLKEVKTGKMTSAPGAPTAGGKGAMTAPPGADGKQTLTQANRTQKYLKDTGTAYAKAAKDYQTELDKIRSSAHSNNPLTPAQVESETKRVTAAYEDAKAQIVLKSAAQIKAIGGDPWKHQAKSNDGSGRRIGTMDGTNWVWMDTGYPVE